MTPAPAAARTRRFVLLGLFAAVVGSRAFAAEPDRALRILWVGNSFTYTNYLPSLVAAVAQSAGEPAPESQVLAAGGWSLEDHWNNGEFRRTIEHAHQDIVVLQQGPSASEEGRASLMRDTRTFAQAIRKAGATPALYMVWPSRGRHRDFPDVVESYRSAARAVDGILLPVGQAWRNLEKADPAMALYSSDDLHPTLRGSYLAAVVIASRLYGLSPRSLAKEIPLAAAGSREIPPEDVRRLQDAAAEAVAGLPPVRLAHSPR